MQTSKFVRPIVKDPDHPGELLLDLGNELCEQLDWQPGDTIEWKQQEDGSWSLTKITQQT